MIVKKEEKKITKFKEIMKPTVLLQKAKEELKTALINPYQESLWILAEILNLSPSEIYLEKENVNEDQQAFFWDKVQKRKQAEPLGYILCEQIFFNEKFYVEKGVFIPRRETETIIQWILKNLQGKKLKAVDFGAGSGALCLTLLSLFPDSQFTALEISRKSIECLNKNSKAFQIEGGLHILQKDVLQVSKKELTLLLGEAPSLIVANPPYIDPGDQSLSQEVYFFEPPLAVFSDKNGMGHIFSWFKKAMECLKPKGIYIFEFGWNQLKSVKKFCEKQEVLSSYDIYKDELGIPRIAVCFKK